MTNEIISYIEMCQKEGVSLQKGMNFKIGKDYSVILMSVRPNSPYRDHFEEDGKTIIYEGHDIQRKKDLPDPKSVDLPEFTSINSLTENGKFFRAAKNYKKGIRNPEKIRVYEKIRAGIWSYNGLFQLDDAWIESDGLRNVFKFRLLSIEDDNSSFALDSKIGENRRLIPTSVKLEVWKRDEGKCVKCGAKNELHFDHIIPYSKGGTSLTADNIQLLCARHNLEKHDKIE